MSGDTWFIKMNVGEGGILTPSNDYGCGQASPDGLEERFESYSSLISKYPHIDELKKSSDMSMELQEINNRSAIDIAESHANKAAESRLLLSGVVTDPDLLPYLVSEADSNDIEDLQSVATVIMQKVAEAAPVEGDRVRRRKLLRVDLA